MAYKTFADVKRDLQVGTSVALEVLPDHYSFGKFNPGTRKIKRRQTNAVCFEPVGEETRGSWHFFQKASHYTIRPDGFDVLDEENGKPIMRYIILKEG